MKRSHVGISIIFLAFAFLCSSFVLSCDVVGDDDDNGFRVMETIPENGATEVLPASVISISFSADIDASTATKDTILVADLSGNSVEGDISAYGVAVSFTPKNKLDPLVSYSVTIKSQIRDIHGRNLASDASFSFTTADY